jgi:ankyrin repeat protein
MRVATLFDFAKNRFRYSGFLRIPFDGCVFQGVSFIAELLLVHKTSQDLVQNYKANALFFAATNGQEKCVEILLKYKVNTHQRTFSGENGFGLCGESRK